MKELLYLKDEQIKEFIEKLFLSYRDTFSDSKSVLNKYSLGIAHNKVLHILSTYEGITIGELLTKLKITNIGCQTNRNHTGRYRFNNNVPIVITKSC